MRSTHALLLLSFGGLFGGLSPLAKAQSIDGFQTKHMSAQYEAEASRLRAGSPQQYDFSKAMLGDVLRFLATDAGISFFSLPDDSPTASRLITFSIKASAFQVLETLCKANELSLIPDNGIWYIRPADDKEMLSRAYEIKNNALEMVEKVNLSSGGSAAGAGAGGGAGGSTPGLDLQGAKETYSVKPSALINSIRNILDLPPEGQDAGGGGGSASGAAGLLGGLAGGGAPAGGSGSPAGEGHGGSPEGTINRKPKVIWQSDSNTLYVVATRLQHAWVEGYLEAADKAQAMIAIEVKFIETSNDPKRELGIDWSGTLGETGTFRQVTEYDQTSEVDPATGQITKYPTITSTSGPNTGGGFRMDLSHLQDFENLKSLSTLTSPELGILSATDLSVKLRALLADEDTKTVSYPRMVTMNNREVAMRSVVNQPVLAASSSTSGGGGATNTASVSYLPIGTVLSILPKKMGQDKVLLNIAVTLSSIIGNTVLQGNPYPIASSRVYSAPVEVNNGYTVAVGGLNEARERDGETGVPILSKIPILGWAFKYKSKERNHKNLLLFITPYLIDAKDGGLPDQPQTVIPQRPGMATQKPKVDAATGALVGGVAAVPKAVEFMKLESQKLCKATEEGIATEDTGKQVTELRTAVTHLSGQVTQLMQTNPGAMAELSRADAELKDISTRLAEAQRKLFAKKYF